VGVASFFKSHSLKNTNPKKKDARLQIKETSIDILCLNFKMTEIIRLSIKIAKISPIRTQANLTFTKKGKTNQT